MDRLTLNEAPTHYNLSQVSPHLLSNDVLSYPTNPLGFTFKKTTYSPDTLSFGEGRGEASRTWWQRASLSQLDDARDALAPLMKYRKQVPSEPLELDLQDLIDSRKWVIVRPAFAGKMMVDEYRKKVEEKIEKLAHRHPTIQRLKQGEDVAVDDLMALEHTLETELGTDELNLTDDNMLKAFGVRVGSLVDFLKHVLKLEALPTYEQIVRKAFDAFILEHNYNADQTRFLRTVQSVFLHKRRLETADLYEPPFSNFGVNAVEKLFSENEVEELMELTKKLAA